MKMSFVRLLLIAVALLAAAAPVGAYAATAISKDEANAHYAQCIKAPDARIAPDTKMEYCACTAAHMMQTMSAEDMKVVRQNDAAARVMLNKMLVAVHGPCLSAPIADMEYSKCLDDPRIALADGQLNRNAMCGCMADKVGQWLQQSGADVMAQTLTENPFVTEPLQPVIDSAPYKEEEYEIMLDCFQLVQGNRR